jgi:Amidohydrolase ring-opening protein (Amido_AtzD_TrzD)
VKVGVHKLPMNSPNDVSALERLIDQGAVNPAEIVALICRFRYRGYETRARRLPRDG